MLAKFLSGRFILTVSCAVVFTYGSVTKLLPAEAIVAVIMYVIQSYFNRGDRKQGEA
jgi:hypothetical protein